MAGPSRVGVAYRVHAREWPLVMAIYNFFKKIDTVLPDESGPLSAKVPSTAISLANKEVSKILSKETEEDSKEGRSSSTRRGQYESFTSTEKVAIAKYALENGVTRAIRRLQKQFSGKTLKEPTVRSWMNKYKLQLHQNKQRGELTKVVKELDTKKRGRPLLLGPVLDNLVQSYLVQLRQNGGVVNSAIVRSAAVGIVKSHDANLLKCNGGHIDITKSWAISIPQRMGYVKRRNTTKAKVNISDFEELKAQFVFDIKAIIEMEEIPPELVINWDHTGINYVPVSNWTMAKEGIWNTGQATDNCSFCWSHEWPFFTSSGYIFGKDQ